jgi:hypothetical protein
MPRTIGPVEGSDLCPTCLAALEPGQHFCRRCASPLTATASTDPIGSIYAQGAMYRNAVAHPRKLIVVIGIWMLCGPLALACTGGFVWFIATLLRPRPRVTSFHVDSPDPIFGMYTLFGSLVFGTIVFRVTKNYLNPASAEDNGSEDFDDDADDDDDEDENIDAPHDTASNLNASP